MLTVTLCVRFEGVDRERELTALTHTTREEALSITVCCDSVRDTSREIALGGTDGRKKGGGREGRGEGRGREREEERKERMIRENEISRQLCKQNKYTIP